jgi:Protein of unknown function (DUF2510)
MTTPALPPPGWYQDAQGQQRYFDGRQWTGHMSPPPPPPPPPPSVVINNVVAAPQPMMVTGGPNHVLHLLLTIVTCGWWLPVWIIVAICSRPKVYGATQPAAKNNTGLILAVCAAALFLVAVASTHPWMLLVGIPLAGLGYLGYMAYQREIKRRTDQAEIANRADVEHQQTMSGDPAGFYGQYRDLWDDRPWK